MSEFPPANATIGYPTSHTQFLQQLFRCPAFAQMFLTPGALFVLVVDMFAYLDEHSREDALEQWLDILQSRVPGSVVSLVGTHRDSFGADSTKCCERTDGFKKGWSSRWRTLAAFVV